MRGSFQNPAGMEENERLFPPMNNLAEKGRAFVGGGDGMMLVGPQLTIDGKPAGRGGGPAPGGPGGRARAFPPGGPGGRAGAFPPGGPGGRGPGGPGGAPRFLREVDRLGNVVWEWHASDHLDPSIETICPLDGRREWTHCNSAEELPDGNLLLSFRQTSGVLVIDRATGKVAWRIQPGVTSHQHAPTLLNNGNYLIFNNGEHRVGGGCYSSVIELDPVEQKVTWEYRGAPRDTFFSTGISNAQRLPNGNTLICEGRPGRIFEVTPDCDIVWDYLNPFHFPHRDEPKQQAIYRAYRYAGDSSQIRNRI